MSMIGRMMPCGPLVPSQDWQDGYKKGAEDCAGSLAKLDAALAEIARLRAERDALPDTIMAALDLELKIGLTHGDWPSLRARVRQAIFNVLETP